MAVVALSGNRGEGDSIPPGCSALEVKGGLFSGTTLQTELAALLDVGKVTLGGLVDRLESSKLVERRPDPADRRAKRIHLTAAAQRLLADMRIAGFRGLLAVGMTARATSGHPPVVQRFGSRPVIATAPIGNT